MHPSETTVNKSVAEERKEERQSTRTQVAHAWETLVVVVMHLKVPDIPIGNGLL